MDPITILPLAVAFISTLLGLLAQVIEKRSESVRPYAEMLRRLEHTLTGKATSTQPLETQLDEAVTELTKSSQRVSEILLAVQRDVEKRQKEAEQIRKAIADLRKEYETNKSLAHLSEEEAKAVRQVLSKEVSVLKRRSYLPDILINVGVGALFFFLGIAVGR
ncbi:hypothetical protein ANRL2_04004 [Anaerolineae bacterium]|nr:hypothetical protein ANRL2_04004 [Anaerolineae bacterium]